MTGKKLEEWIEDFRKSISQAKKTEQGNQQIRKEEWLRSMEVSPTRIMLLLPFEFCQMWARKQDWPMTFADSVNVHVAWYQQLIKWRDGK